MANGDAKKKMWRKGTKRKKEEKKRVFLMAMAMTEAEAQAEAMENGKWYGMAVVLVQLK